MIKEHLILTRASSSRQQRMDYSISIADIDGKTTISSATVATGTGLFAKSFISLIGSSIKAQEELNLASLKKAIEQNTKSYFTVEEEIIEENDAIE